MTEQELTFRLLDDLFSAAARRRMDLAAVLPTLGVCDLGPLVELLLYQRSPKPLVAPGALPRARRSRAMLEALDPARLGRPVYVHDSSSSRRIGFISTAHRQAAGVAWDEFCISARRAAGTAGLDGVEARALIGAMSEIEENIHLHSERSEDGIVAFSASPRRFEFVVADSGIGVLHSLRSHEDYTALDDAGTALRLALDSGHSRFGQSSGHGLGFNSLFLSLAALNGSLRFRTDDHALLIDGVGPRLVASKTVQRPYLQGFLASVICEPLQASLLH